MFVGVVGGNPPVAGTHRRSGTQALERPHGGRQIRIRRFHLTCAASQASSNSKPGMFFCGFHAGRGRPPKFDKQWPHLGRRWPDLGQQLAQCWPTSCELCHLWSALSQVESNLVELDPTIRPTLLKHVTFLGQVRSEFKQSGQTRPEPNSAKHVPSLPKIRQKLGNERASFGQA